MLLSYNPGLPLPAGLQALEELLRALPDLVDVGEDGGPVLGADHGAVVPQLGRVGELGHQHVEGAEVGGLAGDYLELGFLKQSGVKITIVMITQ